jgi:dihydropteroate synthase
LLPVLEALGDCPLPISVDTYKPEVMRAALANGASMINDIYALRMPGAMAAVADSDCAVCLMHMQGAPLTMQEQPAYADVVAEVQAFLRHASAPHWRPASAGIACCSIRVLASARRCSTIWTCCATFDQLSIDGLPLLAGISRKSMLGNHRASGRERTCRSIAAALLATQRGASILRVHDVSETRDALAVWQAGRNRLAVTGQATKANEKAHFGSSGAVPPGVCVEYRGFHDDNIHICD